MTASIVPGGRCQVGSVRRCRGLTDIVPYVEPTAESAHFIEMDTRNAGSSVRIQHLTGQNQSRFPKLEECAHFHYEHVELGPLQITLYEEEDLKSLSSLECNENSENKWLTVKVTSNGQSWLLRRTYENFRMLDQQLHQCIYDRKFSALPELPPLANLQDKQDPQVYIRKQMSGYCERFSSIAGSLINCGPVLSWLQLDNRGRRLLVTDGDNCPINTPAVAAAYAVKNYTAIASDEISFEIGDMISVIDMPPPEESAWWRGKRGFLVGFFPSNYVAIITDKVPRNLHLNQPTSGTEPTKPVLRKHGKLISFFRAFILSRPSRRTLKQSGILKERVFGCDLGEHLLNTGREIPLVLKCCSEFIELHGIVDGIYRLSGVTSNIQKLRNTFDEERTPALYNDDAIIQDIHSVASLLKMYFRELPNPLCTYQLYKNFVQAVQHPDNQERIKLMRNVVEKLPPPHYRTLECLMRHLSRVAEHGARTGMTARNIAIVWAPNLLRCKELEIGGVAALQGVGVQAVVTEFLITYVDMVFAAKQVRDVTRKSRPKSLSLGTAATRLLSLEEAQNLKLDGERDGYIEVGGGPSCLPEKYHTVIELPSRKRPPLKRSPLGWKSLFSRSGSSSASCSLRKSSPSRFGKRKTSLSSSRLKDAHALDASELRNRLRTVKSAESLTSGGNSARNSSCIEQILCPISPTRSSPKFNGTTGHSRTVSHDSYFDHLDENTPVHANDEGLSELQVNFHMDESEMRIFSEEDTTHLFSIGSSMEQSINKLTQPSSDVEDNLVGDSSPKKHKSKDNSSITYITADTVVTDDTSVVCNKRSRLEERLSGNDELAYIDGQANEQLVVEVEVHEQCGSAMTDSTYSTNDTESMQCTDTTGRMAYTPLSEETCTSEIYSSYVDCNNGSNRYSYHCGDSTDRTIGNKIGTQYDSAPTLVETNTDDTYEYICTDKSHDCAYELLTVVEGKITDTSNDNYEDMIRDWPSKDYFDVSVDSGSDDELMVNNNIYESLVADESSSDGNQASHYENVSNDVVEGQPLIPITPEYDALPQPIERPKSLHLFQQSENEVKIPSETTDTPQLAGNVHQLLTRFESCTGNETEEGKSNADKKGNDDLVRRERIEKYKEERRMALRQKYNLKDVDDRDEEMIRRFKQKAQRSPQAELKECDKCTSVTTINILYSPTKDPEQTMKRSEDEDKCRYTLSLERRKRSNKQDSLVAKRVTELSEGKDCFMAGRRVSSAEFTSPNTEKKERITYCIKDIAAIFESKDNK